MPRLALAAVLGLLATSATAEAQQQSLFGGQSPIGQAQGGPSATGAAFEQGGPQISTELGGLSQQAGQAGFLGRGVEGNGLLGIGAQQPGGQGGANVPDFRPGGGGGGANAGRGGNAGGNVRRILRPVSRIAFDHPIPEPAVQVRSIGGRMLAVAANRPEFASVRVELNEAGMATLSGSVPDDATARLATALVRLEPGVRKVRSELVLGENR